MVSTIEELDEMRARAIHETWCVTSWSKATGDQKADALCEARAVREADERAGLVTAPKMPTKLMVMAAFNSPMSEAQCHEARYCDMINASPFAKKEE